MAGESDIIIQALINAGVQIDHRDLAALRNKLSSVGEALGDGGLDALKEISIELDKMRREMAGNIGMLNDAAKRGLNADSMTRDQMEALKVAFNKAKTYQDQLKNLVNQLNKLGNMNLGGKLGEAGSAKGSATPMFNELSALNAKFAQLAATLSSVAPLIDTISTERKAFREAEARRKQKLKQDEARDLKRQTMAVDNTLRDQAQQRGRKAFYSGAQNNYQDMAKEDASAARRYGQAEFRQRSAYKDLAIAQFGINDPETVKAIKSAAQVASALDKLDERLIAAKVQDTDTRKEDRDNRRVAKLERDMAIDRASRSRVMADGRASLAAAGGLGGDVGNFESSDKAARSLSYLNEELAANKNYLKTISEIYGEADPRVRRFGASVDEMSDYVGRLSGRTRQLREEEAAKRKADSKAEQDKKATQRKAEQDSKAESRRAIKQIEAERALEVEAYKDQGIGRRAFRQNAKTGFIRLDSADEAQRALKYAGDELKFRTQIEKLTRDAYGADSNEAQQAERHVNRLAESYARLTNRVNELKVAAGTASDEEKRQNRLANARTDLSSRRDQRAETSALGRATFLAAGGLDADVTKFTNVRATKATLDYLEKELADINRERKELTAAYGAGSGPEALAIQRAQRYAEVIGTLKAQLDALTDAKAREARTESANQRIAAIQRKRDTARTTNRRAYSLLDAGLLDPKSLTNSKDARSALRAGTVELNRMQQIQDALAKSAGELSEEYQSATAEVNKLAGALGEVQRRQEALDALESRAVAVRSNSRAGGRSGVYKAGREAYAEMRNQEGGLESLTGERRDQARSYARERLNETRRQYQLLARQFGQHSAQATAAANAVREYEANLRRLGGASGATSSKLAYLGNVMKMFLKYAIMYQALYQILGAVSALSRGVADLQAEMLEIQAVTGSSAQEMVQLGSAVTQVAQNSKFALADLTRAAKTLAQAGIPIAEINSALNATASFAAATGTNLETAADLISTTRDVFKELTDDVIANQLAKAINVSKLTGEDLKTILSLGAQTARDFNLTSEQFLGAVATLRNAGLKASTVATGLRQGMLELFGPDNTLIKALQSRYKALGENLGAEFVRARFFAFTKASNPLVAALSELKRLGFSDEGQSVLTRAFDVRSSNAIKAMIENLDKISENEARITFGRGAAEGAATVVDGLNASFTRLYSTITAFTYDSSQGFVGWLTEVVQKLDLAIQKQTRLNNLTDATAGLNDRDRENSSFGPQLDQERNADQFSKFAYDMKVLWAVNFDPESLSDPQKAAETRAAGSEFIVAQNRLRADEFERAALAFDVNKAKAGDAVGQSAQALYESSVQLRDLSFALERVFGDGQDEAALRELVKSYTDLGPTQRKVRQASLRDQFKGSPLENLSEEDFDRAMFDLRQQVTVIDGTFRGFVQGWNEKLVKANEVARRLNGEQATTPTDIEAMAYLSFLSRNDDFLALIRDSSAQATEANYQIMLSGSQSFAEMIRAAANGGNPMDLMVRQYSEAFLNRITKLANTTVRSKADAEIGLAVAGLTAQFDGLDKVTIERLQTIQGHIARVAATVEGGAYRSMLEKALGLIQKDLDGRGASVIQATLDRVKFGTEAVGPGIKEPRFAQYMQTLPALTPGVEAVRAAMDDPNLDLNKEFSQDTELSKFLREYYTNYRDTMKVTLEEQDKLQKEEAERLALESQATRATQAYNDANSSKQFAKSLEALGAMTAAEMRVAQKGLEDAKAEQGNFSNTDPSKNREIASRIAQAQARVNEIQEKDARERARIERERLKYNLDSEKKTATRNRDEAAGILRNADGNTPSFVIDAAKEKFNTAIDELLRILEAQKGANGDITEVQLKQFEAEKQKLRHYEDLADSLDLAHRREATLRDKLNDKLEELVQTTGNPADDARMREIGMETGSRAQRNEFYNRRANLLTSQVAVATSANAKDAARYAKNDALIKAGKGTSEMLEEQRKLETAMRSRQQSLRTWGDEIADLQLKAVNASQTIHGALQQAFDIDMIRIGLEQSGSSVEGLAVRIHESLIAGIEGIGDAFADALLEGEDFFDSLNDLFIDTGKTVLRDVIKTYTTESITGLLKGMTPLGRTEKGATEGAGGGLLGTVMDLGKLALDWLTGSGGQNTPALDDGEGNGVAALVGQAGPSAVAIKKFGGGLRPDEMGALDLASSVFGGGGAGGKGCCCEDDSLLEAGKSAGNGIFADVAEGEGKGFFASIKDGFFSVIDMLKGGFGDAIGGIGRLLGIGSGSSGGGAFGLLASVMGFKNGGLIKAATGGIITGPGTGTSDSVPGFIRSSSGKLKPLLTSNGESILNAKATSLLGAEGVHALNSGDFQRANTAGMSQEISRMMAGVRTGAGAGAAAPRRSIKETRNTQLNVTPAQMRMRMGDWLEQHVIEELSQR